MKKFPERTLFDVMQEGYYEVDLKGDFVYVNETFCRTVQCPAAELIGHNFRKFVTPQAAADIAAVFARVHASDGVLERVKYEADLKDNTRGIIEITTVLMFDDAGRKTGYCGLAMDITDRKRLEEELRQSRERFEALFENANELIITTDQFGYIIRLNKKVEQMAGYSRAELVGQSILAIAYEDDRDLYIQFWKDLISGLTPSYEIRAASRTGHVEYLLASGSVVVKEGRIIEVQYNAQIITPLKEAQQTIEGLKNHLKSIIESSPIATICLASDGTVDMVNPVTEKIFGTTSFEGRRLPDFNPALQAFEPLIAQVQESKAPACLRKQQLTQSDHQVFDVNIYPLNASPSGGVVFTAQDVTEKKDMELQLIHAQKMETIGQLVGGIAHDFNNILAGITGNLNMLQLTTERPRQESYIRTIENITQRAGDLIKQLLLFTKNNEGRPESISLPQVVQEVLDMTTHSIHQNIAFEFTPPTRDAIVRMDHTQLTQVILNLVLNAIDAIPSERKGSIAIDINPVAVDAEIQRHYLLAATGRYVRIDVIDNGSGMDEETLPKIFDPFFTTKAKGGGTGLGLAIIYTIIKNAGGGVQVQSQKDHGTRFSILLPLADGAPKEDPAGQPIDTGTSPARIMLVDDEEMLREIGRDMLEFLGHEVVTAAGGEHCLELLATQEQNIDLVILDMAMPGIDGYQTLQQMHANNHRTKVIISSGFAFEHENQDSPGNTFIVGRLNKPFNIQDLSKILAETLN